MILSLDPAGEHFLNALTQLQDRLQRVQRQLSSGVRVERPSDAPESIMDILRRESDISRSEQVRANMVRLTAEVDSAEASLQRAVRVLEDAIVIGSQAASTAIDQSDRRDILAAQVGGLHKELVRLSLVTEDGRFVFGGDEDLQAPYQLNLAQPNGVDRLTTAGSTRQVLDVDGSRFLARRTAEEIFDHRNPDDSLAQDNAFAAVHSLRTAIENDDLAQIQVAMADLEAAREYLNQQLMFYGSIQNRISASATQAYDLETHLKAGLSEIRDTDLAAAAIELTRIQTSIQAALQSRANFTTPTLFDLMG